nr:membrane-spanning 4-domains subfamily A member 4A-like isoform X2 [Nerophis lumbriciformis]XP_061816009.1 membrane-spanning 4-domains subfamily A member 4A-like isoform X2 [Nerophis lumbriciformis]
MADEVQVLESNQNPLVTVSFQRDANRKQKYLEAEPKALGITQIGMSVFQITSTSVFHNLNLGTNEKDITFIILSLLVVIAGSVAIAAKNLHLPTYSTHCWYYSHGNQTSDKSNCHILERTRNHLFAESIIIQVTLLAISITLAAYCCKVVNCCAPAPKMPVITLQTQPAEQ